MAQTAEKPIALITGVRGFTGTYLKAELEKRGFEVVGTSFDDQEAEPGVTRLDIRDKSQVSELISNVKPSVVAHLAAVTYVPHGDAREIYETNIVGTRNLLEALSTNAADVQSVVLASSANIYGNSTAGKLAETSDANPQNDYAVSKLSMEFMARLWYDTLPISICRPFNYTGVGQTDKFLVPKIVKHFARRSSVIELGNLEVSRDFSDVRDVAWVYAELMTNPKPGETFNISSGRNVTLHEIVNICEDLTQHIMKIDSIDTLQRKGEVLSLEGDSTKLWRELGKHPKFEFEQTIAWMLSHLEINNDSLA